MKKILCAVLCLIVILCVFAGCAEKTNTTADTTTASSDSSNNPQSKYVTAVQNTDTKTKLPSLEQKEMKTLLSKDEYTLYQNIFFNNQKNDFNKKKTTKEGTFATLHDAYNNVTRYYVWGYLDNTKCCDWQWEIKFADNAKIPSNGSYVKVEGVYEVNDKALDGLWIINPTLTVKEEYPDRGFDVDMLSMSSTLQWVEAQNIANMADYFKDKTVCGYGRMQTAASVEDPYYDSKWSMDILTKDKTPAFGTVVIFTGKADGGKISDGHIYANSQY